VQNGLWITWHNPALSYRRIERIRARTVPWIINNNIRCQLQQSGGLGRPKIRTDISEIRVHAIEAVFVRIVDSAPKRSTDRSEAGVATAQSGIGIDVAFVLFI
jgi:hypothetical protein